MSIDNINYGYNKIKMLSIQPVDTLFALQENDTECTNLYGKLVTRLASIENTLASLNEKFQRLNNLNNQWRSMATNAIAYLFNSQNAEKVLNDIEAVSQEISKQKLSLLADRTLWHKDATDFINQCGEEMPEEVKKIRDIAQKPELDAGEPLEITWDIVKGMYAWLQQASDSLSTIGPARSGAGGGAVFRARPAFGF
jgi:hypothetical protein